MKNIKNKKTIVGYVRSATTDSLAIRDQKKRIRQYCKTQGYKLSRVFVDNGCSGVNLNRPGLQELLMETAKQNISKVISVDVDRLSRNLLDYVFIKSEFKKHKVEVVFTNGVVLDKATSKSMEELMAAINSFCPRTHNKKLKEQPISVDKQNRFKHLVKISVSEKDLNNTSKFKEMLKDESFDVCTCGLYRSQIVLIAKILRLNLENNTEVKAEFRF
ncbi:MAG: recombinase family protein [Candidatus Shapirobacteria bacterium]|nr:recombinase family protein [Candidatus Shapirobacteria bacterium]